ncbi:hypothetical protein [Massilia rubra]|uniref:Uncharacterized protein n=1 Tax=Massilia rubra TaxID=2607910 RepID=A0ABX0LNJ0_9BURK|nr:hypothetical protein [Massilia rubra]NHZ33472.1 hypothetical protein [Massilia rubra]
MSSNYSFTPQKIAELAHQIREAPPVQYDPWKGERPRTRLEMVAMLKDDIASMRDKGYSVTKIAGFLGDCGFPISAIGLYDAMRKLECSLARPYVPLAQRLLQSLASGDSDRQPAVPGSAVASDLKAQPRAMRLQRGAHAAMSTAPVEPGPQRIAIQPSAQRLLKKLKPSEACVFTEALGQLRPGQQIIRLDAHTADAGKSLAAIGLLRAVKDQGNNAYEVPFEMARIETGKRLER